jgi:uncharacterized protein
MLEGALMSLVIDADGHVEENLAELVGAIPEAIQPHAMRFVSVAGGHVTYEIEGRLWRSKYPYPGGLQNHVSAGGSAERVAATPRSGSRCSRPRGSTPPCSTRAWG